MPNKVLAKWDTLRSLAFGSISGTYAAVGSALTKPAHIVAVINNTDGLMTFSTNGVNDHFVVISNSGRIIDLSSDRTANGESLTLPINTRFYVKGTATSGSVYVEIIYAN